jgi:hypothetical protein
MRIIVCGGRDYNDGEVIYRVLLSYNHHDPKPTLVHGACTGADLLAAKIATDLGWETDPFPAKWDQLGNAAGPIRNKAMARAGADVCIAFPGGTGTDNMIGAARAVGICLVIVGDGVTVTQPTLF